MSVVALLHPDHLLERARAGALSPDEWRALGAHLAACPACAWERAVTDDFAREGAAPASADDALALPPGLLEGALDRAGLQAPSSISAAPPLHRSRSFRAPALRPWAALAMAAAVVAAIVLPATRGVEAREEPSVSATALASEVSEASLDAGALGTPSGGDSS